jgi:hypothetical protein
MMSVDEFLASAQKALAAGNRLVARGYLSRAARMAPDRLDIWRDLLAVSEATNDRLRCLERIVDLDPDDAQAQEALAQLRSEIADAEAEAAEEEQAPAARASATEDGEASNAVLPVAPALLDVRQDVTDEMRQQWDEAVAAGRPLHCIDHPDRETSLRCNRCGAPVCTSCVVRTPVGFRCKECINAQQSTFYNAQWYDYPIAALVSLVLSVPAAVIAGLLGWWFAIIISPLAGGIIGGAVHWAIGRRRGRVIWLLVGVCMVVGALAVLMWSRNLLAIGIHTVMATGAAVGVLRLGRRR